ncbi:MAG: GDSL-type esterase/lipase family protein [Paludibacteraceae bacterium]|nr:GDSL-type esterase/lipase family protein [Paludibacteraceae bacterium]
MKRKCLFILFLFFEIVNLQAKGFLVKDSAAYYDFIVDSLKYIQYPDSINHHRRDLFFDKLDSIVLCRQGKINILHIGGSHVQADFFSHTVRCHLDSINDDFFPSRGVIFPYKVAKTNNPTNYKVTSKGTWVTSKNVKKERMAQLGMTGIAVTTTDPNAEISVKMDVDTTYRWNFTRICLLGYSDSLCIPYMVDTDSTYVYPTYDECTESYMFQFNGPRDSFVLRFKQLDSSPHPFTVCGFITENDENGIVYHSIGVNGASVPSYLSCENFQRDLNLIKPDMVIFGIGINDAVPQNFSEERFIARYDSLIGEIEKINPNCFFIFVTNNDSYRKVRQNKRVSYVVNRNGLKAEHAFYTLAKKYEGGYWNLFGWMGGLESMRQWEINGLAQKDKIHFTKKGYKLIGDVFYNALILSYLEKE